MNCNTFVPITLPLVSLSGQNSHVFKTLVYDKLPAKLMTFAPEAILTGFLFTTSGLLTTATREMMVRAELST